MPVYKPNGKMRPPITISELVTETWKAIALDKAAINPFPLLSKGQAAQEVYQGKAFFVPFDGKTEAVAIPLLTCAAVIYASTHPLASAGVWLHHAGAGVVNDKDVAAAVTALKNPPLNSILVVYAHPQSPDKGSITTQSPI
jgi:hypothetical protein